MQGDPTYFQTWHIGSRSRSLVRLLTILSITLSCIILLYLGVAKISPYPGAVVFIMLLSVFLRTLLMGRLGRWVEFVLKDLADGFTSDAGIYYREILQWHFVEWNGIDRLEYWPRRNHRITMLRGNRPLPIQFGGSPHLASIQSLTGMLPAEAPQIVIREDLPSRFFRL